MLRFGLMHSRRWGALIPFFLLDMLRYPTRIYGLPLHGILQFAFVIQPLDGASREPSRHA